MKILFLCTGNSCRSQMAEGWARHLRRDFFEAHSAGIEKHGMNPWAVRVMGEAGVDISQQRSKTLDELAGQVFDYVITVCGHADERCPVFPGKTKLEKVTSISEITKFEVMMTPALVVDGIVKVVGRVPSVDEVKKILA